MTETPTQLQTPSIVMPKQEPKYADFMGLIASSTSNINANINTIINNNNNSLDINSFQITPEQLQQQQLLMPYYHYYYDQAMNINTFATTTDETQIMNQTIDDQKNEKSSSSSKLDIPPLPIQFVEGQVNGYEVNK